MTPAPRGDARDAADPVTVATQQTLNYALGSLGGRQKAWMNPNPSDVPSHYPPFPTASSADTRVSRPPPQSRLPTQAPAPTNASRIPNEFQLPEVVKRKPGRPPKPSYLESHNQTPDVVKRKQGRPPQSPYILESHNRPTINFSREGPPPSNSTSPQLANVVSTGHGSPVLPHNAALPSPSPSPDTAIEAPATNPAFAPTPPNHDYTLPSNTAQEMPSPGYYVSDLAFMGELQRAASAGKRPVETNETPADKRIRLQNAPKSRPIPPINHAQPAEPRRPSMGQVSVCSSPYIDQQFFNYPSPHQPHQAMHQVGRTPPQAQAPFGPPRPLSVGAGQHPHGPVGSPHLHSPTISSPLAPTDYFTQQDCVNGLANYFEKNPTPSPNSNDGKRMFVLKGAVEKQDWDYLTMHQYYCLLSEKNQRVSTQLWNHPSRTVAMELLKKVLESNSKLSPPVLDLFTNFPRSLERIALNWPRMYRLQEQKFLRFMNLCTNYETLVAACLERKYPPIVRELHHTLGITSPVFQILVFTACLRHVWAPQGSLPQFETDAVAVFTNMQDHFARSMHHSPARQKSDDIKWSGMLMQVCEKRAQWFQSIYQAPVQYQQQTRQQSHNLSTQALIHHAMQPQTAQAAIARGRGRPQMHIPIQQPTLPSQQATPVQLPQNQQQVDRSLFPEHGYNQPQQRVPDPHRFGLHQVNLRSPVLKPQTAGSELYQSFKAFLKAPTRLTDARHKIEKWIFRVEGLSTIPKDVPSPDGAPPSRMVTEQSNMLRIRCVKWPASKVRDPDVFEWATADTSWPPSTYLTFNDKHLQPRKKLYHGKDLPIDINALVKEGNNLLEIAVVRQPKDERFLDYLLAIEVVGFQTHDAIKQTCLTTNHRRASQTQEEIKKKLTPADNDDDEISIVESNLNVKLFDPFFADRLCAIPVRSKACLHIDCFDLETFLRTRTRKGTVTVADQWRCPLCKVDARPQNLIVDGFIEDVQNKLEQMGMLDTRAIIVDQDGTWKPKVEVLTGEQDRGSPDDDRQAPKSTAVSAPVQKAPIEIIDLSD